MMVYYTNTSAETKIIERYTTTEQDSAGREIFKESFTCESSGGTTIFAFRYFEGHYEYDTAGYLVRERTDTDNNGFVNSSHQYDSGGKKIQTIVYSNDGSDTIPFTADDPVGYYIDLVYDVMGQVYKTYRYSSSGADGIFFTADDIINSINEHRYNFNSFHEIIIHYSESGVDSIWDSADDTIDTYTGYLYDTSGRIIAKYPSIYSGTDAIWFNSDDLDNLFGSQYTYNSSGELVQEVTGNTTNEVVTIYGH